MNGNPDLHHRCSAQDAPASERRYSDASAHRQRRWPRCYSWAGDDRSRTFTDFIWLYCDGLTGCRCTLDGFTSRASSPAHGLSTTSTFSSSPVCLFLPRRASSSAHHVCSSDFCLTKVTGHRRPRQRTRVQDVRDYQHRRDGGSSFERRILFVHSRDKGTLPTESRHRKTTASL